LEKERFSSPSARARQPTCPSETESEGGF